MLTIILTYLACIIYEWNISDEFDTIIDNIVTEHLRTVEQDTNHDDKVKNIAAALSSDGTWDDIDYTSESMTEWQPQKHLDRIIDMAAAYVSPESSFHASDFLYEKITDSFSRWIERNPQSRNWWYQYIGCPQREGLALVLMRRGRKRLPGSLENAVLKKMEHTAGDPEIGGSAGTAANKIDIALHFIYRGCLQKDAAVVEKGFRNIFSTINPVADGEGLQYDFSYLQHGPQLYIGGYGDVLIDKTTYAAVAAKDTGYMIPDDKIKVLTEYVLGTYLPAMRGNTILGNTAGRLIARKGALDKSSLVPALERMKILDPVHWHLYDAAIRGITADAPESFGFSFVFKHFYKADYSLSSLGSGQFDVRCVSTRTFRSENGNGENIAGYFLSDGATFITVDGDEYDDIYPIWDWSRIPGTTTPHLPEEKIPVPEEWGIYGTATYAGGLTGRAGGIAAYAYSDTLPAIRTEADKSWFFTNSEVICLGSGISSESEYPVLTTVNQALKNSGIKHGKHGSTIWVWHDRIGYIFPFGGDITVTGSLMSGDWSEINTGTQAEAVSDSVFICGINHGVRPAKQGYAYIVLRDVSAEETEKYDFDHLKIHISDGIHAVCDTSRRLMSFAFFEAGKYRNDDIVVETDKPCLLEIGRTGKGKYIARISSPEQIHKEITVRITTDDGEKTFTAGFPVNDTRYAGRTLEYDLNFDK